MAQNIWLQAVSPTALRHAFDKVERNGGGPGGDGMSTEVFGHQLTRNINALSDALITGIHEPGPCRRYYIPKSRGGTRRLMVPCVKDRIVHTAFANVLSPILEPHFETSSFAYRPGRSVQQAVRAIEGWRNEGYQHVIEADIVGYFDAVRHDLLLSALETVIKDLSGYSQVIDFLADELRDQGIQLQSLGRGIVQGSPLSPLLANLYLDKLDEKIHGRGVRIVRFADDFVILCKRLRDREDAFEELQEVLSSLDLQLHPGKTRMIDFDRGFEFLGYLFVRSLALQREPETGKARPRGSSLRKPDKVIPARITPASSSHSVTNTTKLAASPPIGTQHPQETRSTPPAKPPETGTASEDSLQADYATGDRVLYVLENGRQVSAFQHGVVVSTALGNPIATIPADRINRLEIGPSVGWNPDLIEFCLSHAIQFILVNSRGEMKGMVVGQDGDRARLQFAQASSCSDDGKATILSRLVVDARIRNQRTQLFRLNRRQQLKPVDEVLVRMGRHLRKLAHIGSVDQLRGIEGACGADYWQALGLLALNAPKPFRRTRPATDHLNATINFLTAMLERDVRSSISHAGLHTGFGFLHRPQDYSSAAVYDLMEPFRAPLSEGLAVYLLNSRRLRPEMFDDEPSPVRISGQGRRAIVNGYETAVSKRINVTGKKLKLSWRMMMRRQAQDLAKAYRTGELGSFQPYLMEV